MLTLLGIFFIFLTVENHQAQGQTTVNIAIVNPDHYRIVKFAYYHRTTEYVSIAMGEAQDVKGACPGGWTKPECWTGIGTQSDFLGSILENAGYQVDYFTSDTLPAIHRLIIGS